MEYHEDMYDAVNDANEKSHNASKNVCYKAIKLCDQIITQNPFLYGVPSSNGDSYYSVSLIDSHLKCECTGYKIRKVCAHVLSVSLLIQRQMHAAGIKTPDKIVGPNGHLFVGMLTNKVAAQ